MAAVPDVPVLQDISIYIGNVLEAIIPLIGMIAFIMLLIGGFTILTSAGNPENTKKGQQIITFAVGGIILTIASWLTILLIKNITGVNVTTFELGF